MKKIVAIFAVLLVLSAGFFILSSSNKTIAQPKIPQQTAQTDPLSIFLDQNKASAEIAEAYRFAKENPQGVLSKVRCYCGCLEQDHKNNRDCFFNEDGSFDLMGLNCGLCIKTALTAKEMLAQGKTVDEISDYVDARWGKL